MRNKLKKLGIYLLYLFFFVVCFAISGFLNLPYDEAESLLSRHARVHLNAELEIEESSLSPLGNFHIDRATLTFSPTAEEAKKIADAKAALDAWENQRERKSKEKTELKEQADETKKSEKDKGKNDKKAADPALEKASVAVKVKAKEEPLEQKPIVPAPPFPIEIEDLEISASPAALVRSAQSGAFLKTGNELSIQLGLNRAPIKLNLRTTPKEIEFNLSIKTLDLGELNLIERWVGFPIEGQLNISANIKVPVERETPRLSDLEAEISILVDDKGQIGPATASTKMGEVAVPPLTFSKLELGLLLQKRKLEITELALEGSDLKLCGAGHINLAMPRGQSRMRRPKGKKGASPRPQASRQKTPAMTEQLHSMITGGRANIFARFKFSESFLKRKENGILRLLLNDRSMARGKDAEGFIGHKTTAKLDRIASPLSWTASAQNPLRNSKSRCGTRESSQRKTTTKGKDRGSSFKNRGKTKSKGQPAAPFRPKVNRPPNRKRTVTERPNIDRSSRSKSRFPSSPKGNDDSDDEESDDDDSDDADEDEDSVDDEPNADSEESADDEDDAVNEESDDGNNAGDKDDEATSGGDDD